MTDGDLPAGITGASGVLGRRLCAELRRAGSDVLEFRGDVRETELVRQFVSQVSSVIHAAAVVPVGRVSADPGTAVAVNVGGTAAIAKATADGGKPLVYISTSHVYAASTDPLTEASAIGPMTIYGWTKWQGEQWCDLLHPRPLILRLFSYFDRHQPDAYLVPSLIRRIRTAETGSEMAIDGARNVRDIADASWMARTVSLLVEKGATGVVNCGTGMAWEVLEIARTVGAALGRDDVRFVPGSAPDAPSQLVSDPTRLRGLLASVPPFELAAALRDCVGA